MPGIELQQSGDPITHVAVENRHPGFVTALLVCLMASMGCSTSGSGGERSFEVVRSSFLGSVWNQGHEKASIVSQDGGYSYPVPGGSLWWFGDTFRGSRDTTGKPHFAGGGVSCAVAFWDEKDRRVPPVLDFLLDRRGAVAQAIAFLPGESWDRHRIWPLGGIYVNGKSYIYYSLIEITGKGTWDFRTVGSGLAWSAEPLGFHQRIKTRKGWRFPVMPAAVVSADGWIYLFDVEKRGDRQGMWLARVRPGKIENPADYQFYSGPGPVFSSDKSTQIPLLENIYGQVSVAWNDYLGEYVLASSSDLFRPREIRFHAATEPFGPWSEVVASITVPGYRQGKKVKLVYCSYFHPELFRDNGRIMNLTFSVQLEDAGFDANNEIVEVEVKARSYNGSLDK